MGRTTYILLCACLSVYVLPSLCQQRQNQQRQNQQRQNQQQLQNQRQNQQLLQQQIQNQQIQQQQQHIQNQQRIQQQQRQNQQRRMQSGGRFGSRRPMPKVTKAPAPPKQTEAPKCGGACPPAWIGVLKQFLPRLGDLSPRNQLCQIANSNRLITSCEQAGTVCSAPGSSPNFVCCPSKCLSNVGKCFDGAKPTNLCIPTDIGRWQNSFVTAFLMGGR